MSLVMRSPLEATDSPGVLWKKKRLPSNKRGKCDDQAGKKYLIEYDEQNTALVTHINYE